MAYQIVFSKSAQKELDKLPKVFGLKVLSKIEGLADNPRPNGCKKLEGAGNNYRIRINDYRVIYSIYDRELIVDIIKIDDRKQVYR
jgi:mRNA interferase RelE/StbE